MYTITGVVVAIRIPIIVEPEQMFKATVSVTTRKKNVSNGLLERILVLSPLMRMAP